MQAALTTGAIFPTLAAHPAQPQEAPSQREICCAFKRPACQEPSLNNRDFWCAFGAASAEARSKFQRHAVATARSHAQAQVSREEAAEEGRFPSMEAREQSQGAAGATEIPHPRSRGLQEIQQALWHDYQADRHAGKAGCNGPRQNTND
eukprot:TRINITY_DN20608_c0_g1_i1.p2 TRINITY_DN20608_c0_g1~~TRINITY_DN20608_c0_g1_i1.p2  ORF type:complete len:156 (-),score=21.05 TRINITY_DN20608_c0_g1_i1:771-1217(-)